VAAQPTSTRIGVYEPGGALLHTIDVTSPEFRRTGQELRLDARAEETIRWNEENSQLYAVYQFPRHVASVHYRPKLTVDWVFGQPVNFTVLMNIHRHDGTRVRADVPLPDLSVGQDEEGVFVVDYGSRGRSGSSPEITLSRYPVP
jgi:hypothetical protein